MKSPVALRTLLPGLLVILCGCRTRRHAGGLDPSGLAGFEPMLATVRSVLGTPEIGDTSLVHHWTDVGVGYSILAGSSIMTGFHEQLTLALPTGSVLTIEPGSWIETEVSPDGTPVFRTIRGKITGTLEGGPVEFRNLCGGSMLLTPNPGMRVPVSFDDKPNEELHRLLGLGAPSWAYGDWSVNTRREFLPYVAMNPVSRPLGTMIPEPGTLALGGLGGGLLMTCLLRRQPPRR